MRVQPDQHSSPAPTTLDEQEDPCYEESNRWSMCLAILSLIITLFSKFVFLALFISNGKKEAFVLLLDVLVFAYSVVKRPRYVPQSQIYNCGFEIIFRKKLRKASKTVLPCYVCVLNHDKNHADFADVHKHQWLLLRVREILHWLYRCVLAVADFLEFQLY